MSVLQLLLQEGRVDRECLLGPLEAALFDTLEAQQVRGVAVHVLDKECGGRGEVGANGDEGVEEGRGVRSVVEGHGKGAGLKDVGGVVVLLAEVGAVVCEDKGGWGEFLAVVVDAVGEGFVPHFDMLCLAEVGVGSVEALVVAHVAAEGQRVAHGFRGCVGEDVSVRGGEVKGYQGQVVASRA